MVLLYLTFRVFAESHPFLYIYIVYSPYSPEMNVQVPKSAMFGSLHLTIFLPANILYTHQN